MRYKKAVSYIILGSIIFIFLNALVWHVVLQNILGDNANVGDLTRLGYIWYLDDYREKTSFYQKKLEKVTYSNINNSEQFDLITIGDSFSNGRGGWFYQDYIATHLNYRVLNIQLYNKKNAIETISMLSNSGFFKRVKTKNILIECVERAVDSLSKEVNFQKTEDKNKLIEFYKIAEYKESPEKVFFINTANFKFILYNLFYKFSDNAFFSQVYKKRMSSNLFYTKQNELLFHQDEIMTIDLQKNIDTLNKINENLNKLSKKLEDDGIRLYFMPVVNKYTLYFDYIEDNEYSRSNFFENYEKLRKQYYYIDTKKILKDEVQKGEKEVFCADDTHWSWKAAEAIFHHSIFN